MQAGSEACKLTIKAHAAIARPENVWTADRTAENTIMTINPGRRLRCSAGTIHIDIRFESDRRWRDWRRIGTRTSSLLGIISMSKAVRSGMRCAIVELVRIRDIRVTLRIKSHGVVLGQVTCVTGAISTRRTNWKIMNCCDYL